MKVFLIILAVIVILTAVLLSVSATFTIIYDDKWITKIKVLWIEKDLDLIKILDKLLMSKDKKGKENEEKSEKTESSDDKKPEKNENKTEIDDASVKEKNKTDNAVAEDKNNNKEASSDEKKKTDKNEKEDSKKKKPNYIQSLWQKEGIVGILDLVSNLLSTLKSAGGTLFRGFHIHSLYVKIIVGGGDAAQTALSYGSVCQYYYPIKGVILNGMKVDNYDEMIYPDYIAPCNEYGLQFIGSISVGLLLKVVLVAVKIFGINLLKK